MKMSKKKTFGAPKSFVPPRKLFVGPKVFFHQDQGIVGCTPTKVPYGKSLYMPYIVGIYGLYSPRIPRKHNKYHRYTGGGTPNCFLTR